MRTIVIPIALACPSVIAGCGDAPQTPDGATCMAEEVAGSCDAQTATNRWPQFEGTDGVAPVFTDCDVGWSVGQVPTDFRLTDQFGEPMCLWQLVGKHVVMESTALWTRATRGEADTLVCRAQAYGDQVVFLTFVVQDDSSLPSQDVHAVEWSDTFGLGAGTPTPVVADGQLQFVSDFPGGGFPLPTHVLLDEQLQIVVAGGGERVAAEIRDRLEGETGVNVDHCFEGE
ncbi:MAG: hypothetical protein KTR31_25795 [Myxococcales bacterium]|nr:hypothetical protein [Myxococcales bacterium]